jgi:hypothetical protein
VTIYAAERVLHWTFVGCMTGAFVVASIGCTERSQVTHGHVMPSAAAINSAPSPRDGFEGASLAPFWLAGDYGIGRYAPGAVALSGEYARSGKQSARITLQTGDIAQVGNSGQPNERAELDSGKHSILGRDIWCGFSFLIPPGFPEVDTRLVIAQWKQSGLEGSPIVAQRFVSGRHFVTIRDVRTQGSWIETRDLPPIVPGCWNDMVYCTRFSTDASGVVAIWMNGERVVRYEGITASPLGAEAFYHKVGLYRERMDEPMTIYIDNYAMGASFEDVDPSRFNEDQ